MMMRRLAMTILIALGAALFSLSAPFGARADEASEETLGAAGQEAAGGASDEAAEGEALDADAEEIARERDELARATFLAAHTAFEDGRYEDALAGFRRAYELSGRHQLLFNVGTTADRLRREVEALEAFTIYVRENPNAGNRREVEARMRVLERSVEQRRASDREKEEERRRAAEAERALVELHQSRAEDGDRGGMSVRGRRALIATTTIVGVGVAALVVGLVMADSGTPDVTDDGFAPYRGGTDGSVIFALERAALIRW